MIDVGQTVGNYDITAKLGEGGMGVVFLAEHPVIGSKVALKAIHPHFAQSADVISRFVTEARAVNQIGHDHIVDITDFGNTPAGEFYFIMEYLQGEMLSEALARQGAFPPARALNIAAQIADALQASHQQGVIHRDLKPDNIFLITRDTTQDFVKVLDFGLAKLMHAAPATPTHNTSAGTVMGTPFYMAPEQCEGRAELDHRADIYALGVMLFEMLTGRVPFEGSGFGEVMMKHVAMRPPAARGLVPELPETLDAILSRALSKNPEHRFQSMAGFRAALLDPATQVSTSATLSMTPAIRDAATVLERPLPPTSTFRHGAGERVDDRDLKPKRNRGGLFVLSAAALATAAFMSVHVRREAAKVVASAVAPAKPPTVRVNFSSDPDGATIMRADGTVLGVTPLSIDLPYSDEPVEYRLQKDGYAAKVSSFVPNLPLPVFALLEKDEEQKDEEQPKLAAAANPADDPPIADVTSAGRTLRWSPRSHRHHRSEVTTSEPEPFDDADGVLAPSAP